jgi:sugar lactone lactonase YvrE
MRTWTRRLCIALLVLVVYLLIWPTPVQPVAWDARPSRGYVGAFARNERLAAARLVSIAPEAGPEHIVFGPDGKLYTGVASGAILRTDRDGSDRETFVTTRGRPLGLAFDATGRLIVADALRGLLAVQQDRSIVVLADSVALEPIGFADGVAVASDGRIVFTDATTRFSPHEHGVFDAAILDLLEHSCSGRLIEFDPGTAATRIIATGLCFPNGVALSDDEQAVLVAETGTYRVLRIFRAANMVDAAKSVATRDHVVTVLFENLPGVPDNLTRTQDGRFWLGFTKPRDALSDRFAAWPVVRQIMTRLPRFMWPVPPDYGHVMAFDSTGRIVMDLQDPKARLPGTCGATEYQGRLYLQSPYAAALSILELGATQANRRSP